MLFENVLLVYEVSGGELKQKLTPPEHVCDNKPPNFENQDAATEEKQRYLISQRYSSSFVYQMCNCPDSIWTFLSSWRDEGLKYNIFLSRSVFLMFLSGF